MAYCHECGSEVATNDVFCPYCGIFLTHASPEEEKNDTVDLNASNQTQPEPILPAENSSAEDSSTVDTEDDLELDKIFPTAAATEKTEVTIEGNSPVVPIADDFALTETEESIDLSAVADDLKTAVPPEKIEVEQPELPAADETPENPSLAEMNSSEEKDNTNDFSPVMESEKTVEATPEAVEDFQTPTFDQIPTPFLLDDSAPKVEPAADLKTDETNTDLNLDNQETKADIVENKEVKKDISEPTLPEPEVESPAPVADKNEMPALESDFDISNAPVSIEASKAENEESGQIAEPIDENKEIEQLPPPEVKSEKVAQIEEPVIESTTEEPSSNAETPISELHPKEYFTEQKDPFNETIPDMPAAFNEPETADVNPTGDFNDEVSAGEEQNSNITETKPEEAESAPVAEIAMPSEELALPDPLASQSIFDSVKIIENKPLSIENKAEEPISAFVTPIAESHLPQNAFADSTNKEEPKESRSYTSPIAGSNDTDGKKSTKLKPLDEGTVLNGRYEIIRKIGGGGMGAVYLSSDNNLGGVLRAVKEMVQSYIEEAQQDKAINDFKRESMILSSLDHPSIPTIYDYFYDEKESRFYLVMKYISGGDLSGRLRSTPEGKLDEQTVTEWAIQIADVLNYLHNQPTTIVYRDLKPSNLMIDGNSGRVMLIDFGIARSVNKEEKGVTAVGTMGYAPPELFSGNVEPRSDIYSLGSTMFHLLTGADPQSNPLLIFDFQKNPRPRQINSQLSDQIERILMRAVEYNASARFASAAELKQVLEEHLANLKANRVSFGVKETPVSVGLQDQPVFCGFCGQKIMATDMFCAFCGSKQPLSQKGVHSEIYSHTPVTAKLMLMGTNELDSPIFDLEKDENLVGRRDPMSNIFPEVDLSKFDPQTKISRRHARIWRDGNNFLVEDLGSSNGTIVIPSVSDTTRLLPHQPHVLANGDKIRVGDTTLHFVIR